jgi:hypothetical protein
MQFANRIKGSVTQSLLRALLEDSGYRIVPFGIEEVWRELSLLSESEYLALRLPIKLRQLQDFFVASQSFKRTWLVEVKYRKEWSEEVRETLGLQLKDQVASWSPLYLMMFLGKAAKRNAGTPSAWMGMLRLEVEDGELVARSLDGTRSTSWDKVTWETFCRIQSVFTTLSDRDKWHEQTLCKVQSLLPQLAALDVFD